MKKQTPHTLIGAVLAASSLMVAGGAIAAAPKAEAPKAEASKSGGAPATRDWSQVDTNRDGHVSPEEMERYLKANPGPLAPKR